MDVTFSSNTVFFPDLQELLSQLHHYSANVKHSALLGLKELLSLSPSLLEQHLSRLLSEVAAVLTDKDGNVRVAATRVLRSVKHHVGKNYLLVWIVNKTRDLKLFAGSLRCPCRQNEWLRFFPSSAPTCPVL